METNNLVLKRQKERRFDINDCIICQNSGSLVSTENGRRNIMNAADIRKDEVYERLKSSLIDQDFKYHMNNKCYKNYTHNKSLDKIVVR